MSSIQHPKAIIGLANPGARYAETRHNAGSWFVQALCEKLNQPLTLNQKLMAHYAKIQWGDHIFHVAVPTTYMNHSGQSVALLKNYFKLASNELLIAHDELDIAPGYAKFKLGGGHGGHNGLRDIINAFDQKNDFARLRIGIGHPGHASEVVNYVLSAPSKIQRKQIDECIDFALEVLPLALASDWHKAMQALHNFEPHLS